MDSFGDIGRQQSTRRFGGIRSWRDFAGIFKLQFWAIQQYLILALWPKGLTSDYGEFKPVETADWVPGFLVVLVLVGLTLLAWRRTKPLAFLGASFFILLAPTTSIVPIITEPVAERRMYLPLICVILVVLSVVTSWIHRIWLLGRAEKTRR